MRYVLVVILLFSPITGFAAHTWGTWAGQSWLVAYATLTLSASYGNDFPYAGDKEGDADPVIGFLGDHRFNDYVSLHANVNTKDEVDFLFMELSTPFQDYGRVGVRGGRVVVPSGFFAGNGRHMDRMNFLPQSTDSVRVGRAFYRFDGAEAFVNWQVNTDVFLTLEAVHGYERTQEPRQLYSAATFTYYDYDTSFLKVPDPVSVLSLNLFVGDWQVFATHTWFEVDYGKTVKFIGFESLTYNSAATVTKVGFAYAWDRFEFITTYYETNQNISPEDTNDPLEIGDFETYGASVLLTYLHDYQWSFYGGLEYFHDADANGVMRDVGLEVPSIADYTQGVFAGAVYYFDPQFFLISEVRAYDGVASLVPGQYEVLDAKRYWGVISTSLSYVF